MLGFRISVLLCHSKINNMNDVGCLTGRSTDEEIVRLDVAVNEVLFVNGLDSRQLTHVRGL